jgi:hypothetical protein
MAQASKSRIVIWTIVGILVVVAAAFLIVGRKGQQAKRVVTVEDIPTFVERINRSLEKFDRRVVRAREKGGPVDAFAKIDGQVSKIRAGLDELKGIADQALILPKMEAIKADLAEARKMLREAGGDAGSDEE